MTEPRTEAERVADELAAVLCDPEGRCCIAGSDGDRAVIDAALAKLRALQQARPEPSGEAVPIGWMRPKDTTGGSFWCSTRKDGYYSAPLYVAPPAPAQPNDAVPASGVIERIAAFLKLRDEEVTDPDERTDEERRESACVIAALSTAPASPSPAEAAQTVRGVKVEQAEDAAILRLWQLINPQKTETYAEFKARDPIGWEEHEAVGAEVARAVLALLAPAIASRDAEIERLRGALEPFANAAETDCKLIRYSQKGWNEADMTEHCHRAREIRAAGHP